MLRKCILYNSCNGKMSEFQNSKLELIFFHESLPIMDSFTQVMKILHLFAHSRFFSSAINLLNTNKIQVKCLSVVFRSIPLHLHTDLYIAPTFIPDMAGQPLHLYNTIIQFIGGNKAKNIAVS